MSHISRSRIADLTREMVDIASPVGGEQELAEFLAARFRALGLTIEMQEVEPGRCNLVAILEGTGGGPRLMFGGHLDTPYRGDEEGIRDLGPGFQPHARVDGEWIYGLGASNMKGGIASAVTAIEALTRSKAALRGDVMFAGFVGETIHVPVASYQGARYRGAGVGAQSMVARGFLPDAAIFAIPTSNTISVASGGFVYFELTTRGRPGSPYRRGSANVPSPPATDALSRMLAAVPVLTTWGEHYVAGKRYRGQHCAYVHINSIEGGHPFRPTKLASACRLYLEVGLMPGDEPQEVIDGVEACVREIARGDPESGITVEVIKIGQGAEVSTDEPIVTALSDAYRATWGGPPEITWDGWCTDAGVFTRAGVPAISYGAQGRARSADESFLAVGEHVSAADLVRGAEVFVRAACDIGMQDCTAVAASAKTRQSTR